MSFGCNSIVCPSGDWPPGSLLAKFTRAGYFQVEAPDEVPEA